MQTVMRIKGILLPSDWDDYGQITEMILATSDEAEFRIDCCQSPIRLERYLRQKVTVEAELADSKYINVHTIEICNYRSAADNR